jgi:hypothetical protein
MPNPSLLATHITIALSLTITVGMQSAELARFRRGVPHLTAASTLPIVLWSTPVLALLTFVSAVEPYWPREAEVARGWAQVSCPR